MPKAATRTKRRRALLTSRPPKRCTPQKLAAKSTRKPKNHDEPSGEMRRFRTSKSHTVVARRVKPIRVLNDSIQRPGLGKTRESEGTKVSSAKGAPRPRPTVMKMISVSHQAACELRAKAAAVPRKGAEQGVAMRAANQPLPTELRKPSPPPPCCDETVSSKTPRALRAKAKTMAVRAATKGAC